MRGKTKFRSASRKARVHQMHAQVVVLVIVFFMPGQITHLCAPIIAKLTRVWFLARVRSMVVVERGELGAPILAKLAREWFLTRMYPLVMLQVAQSRATVGALVASKGLDTRVQ